MLSTSWDFKRKIAEDTTCLVKARLILADGSVHDLTGDDIMSGTPSFSHSTSSGGSFDIGAAVTGSFSCTLHNWDRKFDDFDFTGARIIPYLGVELETGIEWLLKGTYYLEQPEVYGTTIGLYALDSMCKFDEVMFSEVRTAFPVSAATLVRDICTVCGIVPQTLNFANNSYVFSVRPKDDMTCHDALSCIAQATGNYVRMTNENRLEFDWYNLQAFESEDWLDGEEFDDGTPYQSGDDADGGNFIDYSSGDVVDGGSFDSDRIVSIVAFSDASIVTDDVIITGIKVTASDEQTADNTTGEKGETVLRGVQGYVLEVEGNPFIAYGEAARVAQNLYNQAGGMRFRPFDVQCLSNPSWEPGDPIVITDYNQRVYRSYITMCNYTMGSYQGLSCNAETPLRRASEAGRAMTKALQALRDNQRAEKTAREAAVEQLNADLASASGMYTTKVEENGATTWYIHDKMESPEQKPGTFTQSQFVWKINAAGFGMSIDGGKSYQYGLDKWGNAILDAIYADTANINRIQAGSIRIQNNKGGLLFCADMNTREFRWDSDYSSLTNYGELTVKKGMIGGFTISAQAIANGMMTLDANGLRLGSLMTLNATGIHLSSSKGPIGHIETNGFEGKPTWNGLLFNLSYDDGWYIAWACQKQRGKNPLAVMLYSNSSDSFYTKDQIHLGCDFNMHNYKIRNASIDNSYIESNTWYRNGLTGTIDFTYGSGLRRIGNNIELIQIRYEIDVFHGFITGNRWSRVN